MTTTKKKSLSPIGGRHLKQLFAGSEKYAGLKKKNAKKYCTLDPKKVNVIMGSTLTKDVKKLLSDFSILNADGGGSFMYVCHDMLQQGYELIKKSKGPAGGANDPERMEDITYQYKRINYVMHQLSKLLNKHAAAIEKFTP